MSLFLSKRRPGRRASRRRCGRRAASSIPATTCAFVTTRPGAATQPEPSIPSPHAFPITRTTLSAASLTPVEPSTAGSGGGNARRRAGERGEGIDPSERVDQPVRRKLLVERREDRSSPARAAQLGLAGGVEETAPTAQQSTSPVTAPRTPPPTLSKSAERAEHEERLAKVATGHQPSACPIAAQTNAPPSATSGSQRARLAADERGPTRAPR